MYLFAVSVVHPQNFVGLVSYFKLLKESCFLIIIIMVIFKCFLLHDLQRMLDLVPL